MLPKNLKSILESESKKFFIGNKNEIIDIILFGSVIKGKENPNDLDILIIFKNKENLDLAYKFRKILEKVINIPIDVTGKEYSELFKTSFSAREALLAEGYSLINKAFISQGLGFMNLIMFNYSLKGKNKSERMRFYYALYGRNSTGVLEEFKAAKYADTIILCPVESQEKLREFFNYWNIDFKETPILMPSRLL